MKFISKIKPIVEQAGLFVLSHFRSKTNIEVKSGGSIVTHIDIACENLLKEHLRELIPGAGFFTEESETVEGNEFRWIIDPIDGTKNFACGIPYFCIAVALEYKGEVIAAVTFAPALQEWFCAEKGYGMWHNDKKVLWDHDYWKTRTALLIENQSPISRSQIRKILQEKGFSASFRYYGAAALDLGYIASGSIDALISKTIYWWDVAGGLLMVQEAGGFVNFMHEKSSKTLINKLYAGKRELYHLLFEKNNSF